MFLRFLRTIVFHAKSEERKVQRNDNDFCVFRFGERERGGSGRRRDRPGRGRTGSLSSRQVQNEARVSAICLHHVVTDTTHPAVIFKTFCFPVKSAFNFGSPFVCSKRIRERMDGDVFWLGKELRSHWNIFLSSKFGFLTKGHQNAG